jgi:N utilization substance protein B
MPNADRNILRIALYEIFHVEDIPVNVSVNEAVELAKEYSTGDSARFINGVLGNVVRNEL